RAPWQKRPHPKRTSPRGCVDVGGGKATSRGRAGWCECGGPEECWWARQISVEVWPNHCNRPSTRRPGGVPPRDKACSSLETRAQNKPSPPSEQRECK